MKIEALHVGMKVRHIQYGVGVVKAISEFTADVKFDVGTHKLDPETSGIEPDEALASFSGLQIPLTQLVDQIVQNIIGELGIANPDSTVDKLGVRWHSGKMVLHPADPVLSTKEVPLETFFHKIVMMRNNLRVLEQKINGHPQMTDGEKVEMEQYISRCYGSMTTFNVLFKNKEDQFGG